MKELFVERKFSRESMKLIEIANDILNEYRNLGYRLSLRQLYYQLVARDFIENSDKSYKRIGNLISDARLAGLVDWSMIEDRNRETQIPTAWENPAEIVRAAANSFRVNRWEGQENYVEVMVEKDALSGILEPVCRQLHVRFTANKGYSSSSAMYEAGKRIHKALTSREEDFNQAHIFYLGDHDPSGIDMTRDITERLIMFSGLKERYEEDESMIDGFIQIHRLALNYGQVELWQPPENPAKQTDSRFEKYRKEFGDSSWELDAVEPRTLAELVRSGIIDLIDADKWQVIASREKAMSDELKSFADEYDRKEKVSNKPKKSKGKKK